MSFKRTLFMAVVLLFVGLFIVRVEIPEEERRTVREYVLEKKPFAEFSRVEIHGEKGDVVLVQSASAREKSDSDAALPSASGTPVPNAAPKWKVDGVADDQIDRFALTTLQNALEGFKSESMIPEGEVATDLDVYGLGEPVLSLALSATDRQILVEFGKLNEYLNQRYARITGKSPASGIGLFPETLFTAANKRRDDFRNRSPIDFIDSELKGVLIDAKSGRVRLESVESGGWRIVEPVTAAANAPAVSAVLRELRNLKVSEFIDSPASLEDFGLTTPDARIEISFKEKPEPLTISISNGPKDKEIQPAFFTRSGRSAVFRVLQSPLDKIVRHPDDLREKKLVTFPIDAVTRVDFSYGETKLEIVKGGESWTVNGKAGDPLFIREFLTVLSNLEAAEFPDGDGDFGFASPTARFQLTFDGAPGERVIVVGNKRPLKKGQSGYAVGVGDLKSPFLVAAEVLSKITPKEEGLLKTEQAPEPLISKTPQPTSPPS